jgi:hypothetical protein
MLPYHSRTSLKSVASVNDFQAREFSAHWIARKAGQLRSACVASGTTAEAVRPVPVLRPAQLRYQQADAQLVCFVAPFRLRKPPPADCSLLSALHHSLPYGFSAADNTRLPLMLTHEPAASALHLRPVEFSVELPVQSPSPGTSYERVRSFVVDRRGGDRQPTRRSSHVPLDRALVRLTRHWAEPQSR